MFFFYYYFELSEFKLVEHGRTLHATYRGVHKKYYECLPYTVDSIKIIIIIILKTFLEGFGGLDLDKFTYIICTPRYSKDTPRKTIPLYYKRWHTKLLN
jgi:hypothetical protein